MFCRFISFEASNKCNAFGIRAFRLSRCSPTVDSNADLRGFFSSFIPNISVVSFPSLRPLPLHLNLFQYLYSFPVFYPLHSEHDPWDGELCAAAVSEVRWKLCRLTTRGWNWRSFKVLPNLSHSVILCLCWVSLFVTISAFQSIMPGGAAAPSSTGEGLMQFLNSLQSFWRQKGFCCGKDLSNLLTLRKTKATARVVLHPGYLQGRGDFVHVESVVTAPCPISGSPWFADKVIRPHLMVVESVSHAPAACSHFCGVLNQVKQEHELGLRM